MKNKINTYIKCSYDNCVDKYEYTYSGLITNYIRWIDLKKFGITFKKLHHTQ